MLALTISLDTDSRGTTAVETNTGMKLKVLGIILRLEEIGSAVSQKGVTGQ